MTLLFQNRKTCIQSILIICTIAFTSCKKETITKEVYTHIQRSWISHIECPDSMKQGETHDVIVSYYGAYYSNIKPDHIELIQSKNDSIIVKAYFQYTEGSGCFDYTFVIDTMNPMFRVSTPFTPSKKGKVIFISNEMNTSAQSIVY